MLRVAGYEVRGAACLPLARCFRASHKGRVKIVGGIYDNLLIVLLIIKKSHEMLMGLIIV